MTADRQVNHFEVLLIGAVLGALAVGVPGYLWHNQQIQEERRLAEEAKARALKEQLEDPAQLTRLLLDQAARQITPENMRNLAQLLPKILPGNGKDDKGKGLDINKLLPFLEPPAPKPEGQPKK
jgi:uncharacterized protein HemX